MCSLDYGIVKPARRAVPIDYETRFNPSIV
jgi:hypothetical protein